MYGVLALAGAASYLSLVSLLKLNRSPALVVCSCFFALLAVGCASLQENNSMTWNDSEGRQVNPFGTDAAVVFLFVRVDCPISNHYAPEIERLYSTYDSRRIVFWLVYPDADTTAEDIKSHGREYHISLPALRDPELRLVKMAGVKVTPEAAVFVGKREVYRGRIDDRYVELGKERPIATEHDLQEAIKAVLAGKPSSRTTLAVGCYISQ